MLQNRKMLQDIHRLVREKNRMLNQWEQYYRKDKLKSFPIHIQFPTGTRCNLQCQFCTERKGEKAKDYHYKDLNFGEFRSVIEYEGWNQSLSSASKIALYGWGEPLFNTDYEKIFDYIMENFPGLGIIISTNGILFSQKWSEKIVAIDNAEVNFSVNAATKETYRNVAGSNQFERLIANICGLTDLREKYRTKNPYITLSYVVTTENIRELPQFVDLSATIKADCIVVQDTMMLSKDTERLSLMNEPVLAYEMCKIAKKQAKEQNIKIVFVSFEAHQESYFPSSFELTEDFDVCTQTATNESKETVLSEGQEVPSAYFANTDCFDPWERFMIRADGEVFPCCQSQTFPELTLGSIHKQSFEDIWNGDAYRSMRRTINTDNPPPVCAICPRKIGLD